MEGHNTLKLLLDTLFSNLDLKSYTIHDNSAMTVCTLRFGNDITNSNSPTVRNTYKKKSEYHIKRDKARHDRHIKPVTRSQASLTSEGPCENRRVDDISAHSVPGLSPEHVHQGASVANMVKIETKLVGFSRR